MPLNFRWSRFDELSTRDFYEIVKARESVFVVEQQCAYQEVDELDPLAWHLPGHGSRETGRLYSSAGAG
ncbi:hypothetical protein HORIV_49350 [Vreelandella olivaria]|uniref:Uncharacterized protein n=1 Tax=Vreelandella olivaria TaxID=390919 RepID=A0ABN5WZU3_9GAMM|nr:hypothetical protein HORIV_49350 [Halomonas olivaria]